MKITKTLIVLLSMFALLLTGLAPASASIQDRVEAEVGAEYIPPPTAENTIIDSDPEFRSPTATFDACVASSSRRSVIFADDGGYGQISVAPGRCSPKFRTALVWTGGNGRGCEFYLNGAKQTQNRWIKLSWYKWYTAEKRGTC